MEVPGEGLWNAVAALAVAAGFTLWLLAALGYKLSVAVAVGAIAVAGLAVELGLLMMVYLDIAWRESRGDPAIGLDQAIIDGASQRIRPMLMTGLTLVLGLAPVMLASGAGSDVMKRIAAPMLGGAGTALLMALVVMPKRRYSACCGSGVVVVVVVAFVFVVGGLRSEHLRG